MLQMLRAVKLMRMMMMTMTMMLLEMLMAVKATRLIMVVMREPVLSWSSRLGSARRGRFTGATLLLLLLLLSPEDSQHQQQHQQQQQELLLSYVARTFRLRPVSWSGTSWDAKLRQRCATFFRRFLHFGRLRPLPKNVIWRKIKLLYHTV